MCAVAVMVPVATRRAMAQALHRVGRHEEAARQEAAADADGRAPTADWDEPGGP
jgi:hypothetical protein